MAVNPSIQLGTSGNWAIKEDNLLAYKQLGNKFFDREFDFSRGTTATFVGRNGLIQESGLTDTELVTNGDFATDTDWSKGTGWAISNGKATHTGSTGNFTQNIGVSGKKVLLTFEVLTIDNGVCNVIDADISTIALASFSTIGVKTVTLNFVGNLIGLRSNSTNCSITNISVKEIQLDVPRIDFADDTTGHLLLEPQSTNLITYSEDFANAAWSKTRTTVNSNNIISPNGALNADKISETNETGLHAVSKTETVTNGVAYTFSAFIKKGSSSFIQILFGTNNVNGNPYVNFNINQGIYQNNGVTFANIENYGNDWYRCSATITTATTSLTTFISSIQSISDSRVSTFTGNVNNNIYVWGAMLEQLSYPTSYIPTSGSAVTRNQELCNNSGTVNDFNSEEGVLYAEIAALADDGTNRLLSLSDGTTSNRIFLGFNSLSNSIRFRVQVNNVYQAEDNFIVADTTQYLKIGFKFKENDFALWINGVEVLVDNSGSTFSSNTLNKLSFDSGAGGSLLYGRCKNLKVFKRALTDAELYLLTVTQYQSYQEMATALNYTL